MANVDPIQFLHEVRQEAAKVTWPTRKEAMISTGMVFVMVFVSAVFFFVVDWFMANGVKLIFGLGT